jgi:glycosyltransferase involved in cell wall biosynthesis
MSDKSASILFIPKWFPGKIDPQNGVFLYKHAQCIAAYYPVKIMHLCPVREQLERFEFASEAHENIEILHCYYKTGSSVISRPFNLLIYLLAFLKSYKKLYPSGKPILTHAHIFTRTGVLAYLLKIWKGVPYIISEQWSLYFKGGFEQYSFIRKEIMRLVAKNSCAITAVSGVLLQALKERGLVSQRMKVIGNAVPLPDELNTNKEKKVIGVVADFDDENKRISTVMNTFSELSSKYPEWELHIVGGGKDEQKLHQLASDKQLKDKKIFFHGRQDNKYVYQFLKDIAFLVNFSVFETFSVILIEAILHGKPVISSKCGGPESFINDDNGVLIDKNDIENLKNAMAKMMQSYKDYNTEKLIASVEEKYSPENIGKAFHQLYREILDDNAQ